ncbi:hypothetical protein LCGC14_3091490, partial [marine sediment metagenome]
MTTLAAVLQRVMERDERYLRSEDWKCPVSPTQAHHLVEGDCRWCGQTREPAAAGILEHEVVMLSACISKLNRGSLRVEGLPKSVRKMVEKEGCLGGQEMDRCHP